MRKLSRIICVCLILAGLALAVVYWPIEISPLALSNQSGKTAKVIRVIDGDTIILDSGETVRYIGIDAPEIKNNECFAKEAREINQKLLLNKYVQLEQDISQEDAYHRILRYVYLLGEDQNDEEKIFVNKYLVENGYARPFVYPPDIKYKKIFQKAEESARDKKLGLWNLCLGAD